MELLMNPVNEPSVWMAEKYRHTDDWIEPFTAQHLEEIDTALEYLRAKKKDAQIFKRKIFRSIA